MGEESEIKKRLDEIEPIYLVYNINNTNNKKLKSRVCVWTLSIVVVEYVVVVVVDVDVEDEPKWWMLKSRRLLLNVKKIENRNANKWVANSKTITLKYDDDYISENWSGKFFLYILELNEKEKFNLEFNN